MNDQAPKDTSTQDPELRQGNTDALAGFLANDTDGDSSIGHPSDGNQAQSGINSNFAKASPESNVSPAGTAQVSHGNATGDVPGGTRGMAPGERKQQLDDGTTAPPATDADDQR